MTSTNTAFSLGTFSIAGARPFPGIVIDDKVLALSGLRALDGAIDFGLPGCDSMLSLVEHWEHYFPALQEAAATLTGSSTKANALRQSMVPLTHLRTHAPLLPRQIFCTGANYFKHVVDYIVSQGPGAAPGTDGMTKEELKVYACNLMEERSRTGAPYVFSKVPSAVTGPHDPVILPKIATQVDWELELGVVIGKAARNVPRAEAMNHVAGYTIVNDISARDLIFCKDPKSMGTDWVSSKNAPGFLPMGPYIVPAAFVDDPQQLRLTLKLNGETMQDETTADMIFDVARQIEYISSRVQLWPGDVICTGSPAGNGIHYNRYLREGDVMTATITGLGMQQNPCIDEK